MLQLRRLLPAAATLLLAPAILSQTANPLPSEVTARIDAAAEKQLAATGVPSASVAVVKDGQIVYVHAYGKARLDPPLAATPDMQYSIGSVSKQFTAFAMLLLQEQGKLRLDDPVSKYLPELTRANEVTLRMLLSHTSGYQDFWPEDYVMTSMLVPTTAQHILDVWAKKPLDFDPGTRWQYSNTNYVIAGRIVEQVSGQKLVDLLTARVFEPLGMTGVLNQDAARLPATDPVGYYRHALGPLRPSPLEGFGWMFAAGELAMPARDLALWNISLIDRSLLKPASYDEMFREVKLKDGEGTGYGLGVEVENRNGHRVIFHSGEVSGFVSANTVYPDDKAAVTVLTNEDASAAAGAIAKDVAGLLLSPAAAEDGIEARAKAEARALGIFTGLEDGELDRSQLTPYCNAYFSPEAVTDFASSLKPLGAPKEFKQVKEEQRGGMTFRVFRAKFPEQDLVVTTYEMPDGKLEQYLVIPASS
ncbi:MAG: D-alanyl-D-alanine carboxypeptidase [Acidobacteriaceae bacterium]|nr:D-alanyl-D-alanine carboxypeptidase [Acidobacteriaceae bacterium]